VVMTVIGLLRDEFRIHARIQRLKAFSLSKLKSQTSEICSRKSKIYSL